MAAYYNEWDKNAAAWLRELIKRGLIAYGEVDERSITEVAASDLRGFDQCHFFAGIGGWSLALRLAGVDDSYPVWTASLPCQPFSSAGKQLGKADERHLLPHYIELVRQCKPNLQLGEQVEGAIRHGWLDDLQATMEAEGYTVGHCVLGAHSVNAPHIRQRLYWVADSCGKGSQRYWRSEQVNDTKGWQGEIRHNTKSGMDDVWTGSKLVCGLDSKHRPVKPGIKPLVDGIPRGMVRSGDTSQPINANETQEARVMRLKGYGNAIVPQVAAEFIGAFLHVTGEPK